jgi:flagellar L-ring protein precursor FlgH
MKKYFLGYAGVFLFVSLSFAGSLWGENSRSRLLRGTKFNVGDTITIVIDESLNAAQSGTTRTDKSDNMSLNLSNSMSGSSSMRGRSLKSSLDDRLALSTAGRSNYSGTGSTTRVTTLKTTITATVIDVQPNGTLFVLGQRSIRVNEEVETIEVSGLVNVDKLSDDNSIQSTQIANAKITIKGAGVVSSPQQPGVLVKMFDWLF